MKRLLCAMVFTLLMFSRAEAAPILVSAGEAVIFNFDLTGAVPPPPYTSISAFTGTDSSSLFDPEVELGGWQFFSELNGTGALFRTGSVFLSGVGNWPGMFDGVFSVVLTLTHGSLIVNPSARGSVLGVETGLIPATVASVPEPATLALFASGLVTAAVRRSRIRRGGRSSR